MDPRYIYLQQLNANLHCSLEQEKRISQNLKYLNNDALKRVKVYGEQNEQFKEMNDQLTTQNQSLEDEIRSLNLDLEAKKKNLEAIDQKIAKLEADLEVKTAECENFKKELQYQKVGFV